MAFVIKHKVNDTVIAQGSPADESAIVYEGNWYFRPEQVDMTYLRVTERTYTCPYKGVCFWVDLESPELKAQNIGWVYPNPMPGHEVIKDRIAFYARDTQGTIALK